MHVRFQKGSRAYIDLRVCYQISHKPIGLQLLWQTRSTTRPNWRKYYCS